MNSSNLAKQARFRVTVNVEEFHVDPQGQARLVAQWRVARRDESVVSREAAYREVASTNDYRVMASALNACLNRFSRDVAATLRHLAAIH